ncbi:MAG: CRISPR system Cmr subunit Cmr2 [Thermococcales archaeon 44_46]|jgi:CRISPR-associated protein Cmr2|uniref:type III-B CRISPR-associated protein Cas10/Cmr2 n=1 Tax=Thermococcus sp. PK TaxID=913025 RepID=UPI0005B2E918|nr:type III-B CRISPR-associated protein Cas10/Cmr2 [Thermococcus sp. PK]KUK00285.1 MAG: CRISPR system Cmr subunit Cmr2 [Thermococcales archaeon 44_46]MDK2782928.1 CRISPR-associated protein Cmr2 [Thermococcaceae archaeon]MDK2982630.1 CRISPR-associated protein Cmr2 [Thermococcaceae archaeon]HIH73370.1 type III-B CRISPR-associated protein Cas10/Cmr2 [Thermococcaceae archaeon]
MNLDQKLKTYFHDPPDKALKITGHKGRAKKILNQVGISFEESELIKEADRMASAAQRLVFKVGNKDPASDFYGRTSGKYYWVGYPVLVHPVNPVKGRKGFENLRKLFRHLISTLGYKGAEEFIGVIVQVEGETLKELYQESWVYIWNNFPQRLEQNLVRKLKEEHGDVFKKLNINLNSLVKELIHLPAETRFPDHTIWHHLDLTSALAVEKPVLMRIKIVPVQSFIKNARKQLDLWAGSHMVSFLTFKAIEPIIEEFGPEVVIYPALRDQPLLKAELLNAPDESAMISNIPNKALVVIPEDRAGYVEKKIKENVKKILKEMFNSSLDWAIKEYNLDPKMIEEHRETYWHILEGYFTVSVEWLPLYGGIDWDNAGEILQKANLVDENVRKWMEAMKEAQYERKFIELYPFLLKILEGLGEAKLSGERFKKGEQPPGWKCHMCGENLAILGNVLKERELKGRWKGEPLCPVCMIKRYYPEWLKNKGYPRQKFESIVDVALLYKNWREKFDEEYGARFIEALNGIHRCLIRDRKVRDADLYYLETLSENSLRKKVEELGGNIEEINWDYVEKAKEILMKAYKDREIGKPSKYYAILMMDGDNMGKVISGECSGAIIDHLHPEIAKIIPEDMKSKLNVQYYSTPQLHRAISEALTNFSLKKVKEKVEENGLLIYAGGDDVLAILPIDRALEVAKGIRDEFGRTFDDDGYSYLPAGKMSAGLLIVHYKHPLYDALDKAKELEREAKEHGKNCITIGLLKHNGSYYKTILEWGVIGKELDDVIKILKDEGSKRLIYHVLEDIDSWPEEGVKDLLKYEIHRHVSKDKREQVRDSLIRLSNNVRAENLVRKMKGLFTLLKILLDMEVSP